MEQPTTTTASNPITVAGIEDELRRLWREIAEQPEQHDIPVTRVCTWTLIAYGANASLAERVRRAVPAVYAAHPCRAILIEAAAQPAEWSAWVTTVCQRSGGEGQQVCCEQITINAGEERRRRLPGTILPLVVSDLPIAVWWPGPLHPASNVRNQLYAHADRWIVDSADFPDPLPDLARLHALLSSDAHTAVSDLSWARLTPWRSMVAQIFDHPATRPALGALTRVTLRGGGHQAAALLSIGWLASCLGWAFERQHDDGEGTHFHWRAAHGPVEVVLALTAGAGRTIHTLELTSLAVPDLRIALERNSAHNALICTVEAGGAATFTQAVELRRADDGALLNAELNVYGHDRIFEAALAVVAAMAGGAQS